LADARRLTAICMPPHLDLVIVGEVWCRLLVVPQTVISSVALGNRKCHKQRKVIEIMQALY
jgi:hypothetical protein